MQSNKKCIGQKGGRIATKKRSAARELVVALLLSQVQLTNGELVSEFGVGGNGMAAYHGFV